MDEALSAARRALLQNPRDFHAWRRYRRCALRSRAASAEELDPRSLYIPTRTEGEWQEALRGWRRRVQVPGRQRGRLLSAALSWDGSLLAWICGEAGRNSLKILEIPEARLLYEGRGSWSELSFCGPDLLVFGEERCGHWSALGRGRLEELGGLGAVRLVGVDEEGWLLHALTAEHVLRWPGGVELGSVGAGRRPLWRYPERGWLSVPYQKNARGGSLALDFGEEGGRCQVKLLAWDEGRPRLFVWFGGGRMPPPVGSGFAVVSLSEGWARMERVLPIGHYHSASFSRTKDCLRVFCDGVPRSFHVGEGRFTEGSGIGLSGGHAAGGASWRESAWHPFADVASFRESRSGVVQLRTADGASLLRKRGVGGVCFGPTGRGALFVLPARGSESFRLELWGEESWSGD